MQYYVFPFRPFHDIIQYCAGFRLQEIPDFLPK